MSNRPLIGKSIRELENLYKMSYSDIHGLEALENELIHRNRARAVRLLGVVRKALSNPVMTGTRVQTRLFDVPPGSSTEINLPAALKPFRNESGVSAMTKRAKPKSEPETRSEPMLPFPEPDYSLTGSGSTSRGQVPAPEMTIEQACAVLRVTEGTSWEAIENARRQIVDRAHPVRVKGFDMEKRRSVEDLARRANAASRILFASRIMPQTSNDFPASSERTEPKRSLQAISSDPSIKKTPVSVTLPAPIPIDFRVAGRN